MFTQCIDCVTFAISRYFWYLLVEKHIITITLWVKYHSRYKSFSIIILYKTYNEIIMLPTRYNIYIIQVYAFLLTLFMYILSTIIAIK